MKKENIYYILIAVLAIVIGFALVSVWNSIGNTEAKYSKALAAENMQDICATPEGYTDKEWREHMSHHPDRYKQCLGG